MDPAAVAQLCGDAQAAVVPLESLCARAIWPASEACRNVLAEGGRSLQA
jgi:hypothetical protein